jgi:hypothetical protein
MPNHVTNIVKFIGDADAIAVMRKEIYTRDEERQRDNHIDFDTFAPMPEEIRVTSSPAKVVSEDELATWLIEKEANKDKPYIFDYRPITAKEQKELIAKYGTDNWYDWAVNNWGTKWGAYDTEEVSSNELRFLTAWATPYKALLLLSEKYPDITIDVSFADEDFGHNTGRYQILNGVNIMANVPDGGSLEAYEIAVSVLGGENIGWYLSEKLEDIDPIFLELAVRHSVIHEEGEMEEETLSRLLEMAIEAENYEYAATLREELKDKV